MEAQDTTLTLNLTQILTFGSIVLTVLMLLWSLSKGRRETRLRPLFDIARVVVQITVVVAIPFFTGVVTPVLLILGALLIGLSLGFLQGQNLEVKLEDAKIMVRRSIVGFGIWGGGLVMMQAAGLANRTGLVQVGQALSWFSIGVTVGVIFGRHTNVDRLLKSAALTVGGFLLVAAPVGVLVGVDAHRPAAAQACPSPPSGFSSNGTAGDTCKYIGPSGETAALSSSGSGCGADRIEEWTSRGGVVGQDVNIKDDGPADVGDGFTYFQRYMVLGRNGVVAVASRNFSGGVAQQFIAAAKQYSLSFQPMCADTGGGNSGSTGGGESTGGGNPPPPVVTRVEVEDIDPNAIPPSQTIPDEGGELFPTIPPTTQPQAVGPQNTSPPSTNRAGLPGPDEDEGTFVAPPIDDEDSIGDDEVDDGDEVTEEEALAAAISGLIAAAMAGIITWSEAAANINELLGEAGRERNAEELIDSVRQQFGQDMAGAPPVDPNDPRTDIFRHPDTGEILISDGSQGAPPGYVWDPWGSRWLSPAEAAAEQARTLTPPLDAHGNPMRVSSGHDRFPDGSPVPPGWVQTEDGQWVSPEAARQRVAEQRQELEDQARRDREWDEESERDREAAAERDAQRDQERREQEEAEAREREAAQEAADEAYEQLERIRQSAERRGWDDIIDRMDNAYDEDGNIRPEYVDQLADLVSNRIGEEIMRGSPSPSMLAETLRSLDEDYGDLLLAPPLGPYIREQVLDGIQHMMEETYFGEAVSGSLTDMRNSMALRMLSGIASGGASEVVFQSADLGDAILRDIDQAIKDGVPAERFAVLEQTARTLIENNTPINTARLAFGDKPVTPTQVLIALVGDVGALFDIGTAGQRGTVLAEMPWQRGLDATGASVRSNAGRAAARGLDSVGGEGTARRLGETMAEASQRAQRTLQGIEDRMGINPNPGARGVVPESARGTFEGDGRFRGTETEGASTTGRTGDVDTGRTRDAGSDGAGRGGDADADTGRTDGGDADADTGRTDGGDADADTGRTDGGDADADTGRTDGGDADADTGRTDGGDADADTGRTDGGDADADTGRTDGGDADADTGRTDGGDADADTGRTDGGDADADTGRTDGGDGDIPTATDEWLQSQPPGTVIPIEYIREAGYTPAQAAAMRRIAEKYGIVIGTRGTNIHATKFIENGTAIPKPVWMKPKTINHLDELLGGPSTDLKGQVGFFKPEMPDPPYPAGLEARFNERLAEFNELTEYIDGLKEGNKAVVVDGVVHSIEKIGPPMETLPFAGDIDGVVMLKPDGTPVSGAEYQQIVQELKDSNAMLQHGFETNLVGDVVDATMAKSPHPVGSPEWHYQEREVREAAERLFGKLDKNHLTGKEQVIWTGPNGHTIGDRFEQLSGYQELVRGRWANTSLPDFLHGRPRTGREEQ